MLSIRHCQMEMLMANDASDVCSRINPQARQARGRKRRRRAKRNDDRQNAEQKSRPPLGALFTEGSGWKTLSCSSLIMPRSIVPSKSVGSTPPEIIASVIFATKRTWVLVGISAESILWQAENTIRAQHMTISLSRRFWRNALRRLRLIPVWCWHTPEPGQYRPQGIRLNVTTRRYASIHQTLWFAGATFY
jgi:hypothetical protein